MYIFTVYIVCGLIGAGKSTWARQNFAQISEYEQTGNKGKQIRRTIAMLKHGNVAHVTTVPTQSERRALEKYPHRYILIDTGFEQAKKNIIQRNRPRDIQNQSWNHNMIIKRGLAMSNINFVRVSLDFKNDNQK